MVNATPAPTADANVAVPPDVPAPAHTSTESARQPLPSSKSEKARGVSNRAEGSGGIQQSTFRGTWEIPGRARKTGTVHLRLTEGDWSSGFSIPVDRLEGISSAQLAGASGPVKFSLRRDAGTFAFEGTARDGVAGGVFYFSPNTGYGPELEKRGYGWPTDAEQYLACARRHRIRVPGRAHQARLLAALDRPAGSRGGITVPASTICRRWVPRVIAWVR